jgi:hypothetical protein
MSNLRNQRGGQPGFPFLLLPQFFLAGVFNPINDLPPALNFFSSLAPMHYAVDLMRAIYYAGKPEYDRVVLLSPTTNLLVIAVMFAVFLGAGTGMFVRRERNPLAAYTGRALATASLRAWKRPSATGSSGVGMVGAGFPLPGRAGWW